MKRSKPPPPQRPIQLSLPLEPARAPHSRGGLRVIEGGGRPRSPESLSSPEAVIRLLVESGADLLLRRITPERAQEIEKAVNRVLGLFEKADKAPRWEPTLRKELDALQRLMTDSRARKRTWRL